MKKYHSPAFDLCFPIDFFPAHRPLPCMFAPPLPNESTSDELRYINRMQKLTHGQLHTIHQQVTQQQGYMPPTEIQTPTPQAINRRVIAAVNTNQLTRARKALEPCPVAIHSDHNIHIMRTKHVFPKCTYHADHQTPIHNPPLKQNDPAVLALIHPTDIHQSLKKMAKGSAPDIHGTTVDFLRATATYTKNGDTRPGLTLLSDITKIIVTGQYPKELTHWYTSNNFIMFHKDLENEPDNLRPLECGSALRRIVCSHAAKSNVATFAAHTAPHQFAIGIPGGMDMALHIAMLNLDKYVTRTKQQFQKRHLPTRFHALLDFEKMYTRVSRRRIRELLDKKSSNRRRARHSTGQHTRNTRKYQHDAENTLQFAWQTCRYHSG